MDLGQGPHAVARQELVLAEDALENASQPLLGDQGQEMRAGQRGVVGLDRGHVGPELRVVGQEPVHPVAEQRHPVEFLPAQRQHREERHEAHDRVDLQEPVRPVVLGRQLVEVEALLLVPEPGAAERVHRVDDRDVVPEELARDVLEDRPMLGQFHRDAEHGGAEQAHPGRRVGLAHRDPVGQRHVAVEHADVVQPEEPAAEQVAPSGIVPVDPPVEVEHQLVKGAFQEIEVRTPRLLGLEGINLEHREGVDGRVDVAE